MYADDLTVLAARDQYLAANGFSLAGYTDRWVKIKLGPLPVYFPNTASRKAAVVLHDLHHVATGYATTWTGEAEIGAWEVAAGCGRYRAAWFLNLSALGIGLWLSPRRVFRAFVRGRHTRTLYDRAFGPDLLELRVGELREKLRLTESQQPARAADLAAFVGWLGVSAAIGLALLLPVIVVIWWLV